MTKEQEKDFLYDKYGILDTREDITKNPVFEEDFQRWIEMIELCQTDFEQYDYNKLKENDFDDFAL